MKICFSISLLLLCAVLLSCNDDEESVSPNPDLPDAISPVVDIISPAAKDSILVIDVIPVYAELLDNKKLEHVKVTLTDPVGSSAVLLDYFITDISQSKRYDVSQAYRLPQYATTGEYISGDYIVEVEARDEAQNVTKKSVTFTLHASDINRAVFANAFGNALVNTNPKFSGAIDLSGDDEWGYWFVFDELMISTILNLMVSTDSETGVSETEWARFMADFGIKNQSWAKWNQNNDGYLNSDEFHKGIVNLNLFRDWDTNQDSWVDFSELAGGVFSSWDLNKDNRLGREEYPDKFYIYLYSRSE